MMPPPALRRVANPASSGDVMLEFKSQPTYSDTTKMWSNGASSPQGAAVFAVNEFDTWATNALAPGISEVWRMQNQITFSPYQGFDWANPSSYLSPMPSSDTNAVRVIEPLQHTRMQRVAIHCACALVAHASTLTPLMNLARLRACAPRM